MWNEAKRGEEREDLFGEEYAPSTAGTAAAWPAARCPAAEAQGDDRALLRAALERRWPAARAAEVSERLFAALGDLLAVLSAPAERLRAIPGLGAAAAPGLERALREAARELSAALRRQRPKLDSVDRALSYLAVVAPAAGEAAEGGGLRVLYLDAEGRLMADEHLRPGPGEPPAVLPVDVVHRGLQLKAAGMVLAHRHEGAGEMPGREEIVQTHHIQGLAQAVGIALHDHVVIAGGKQLSMRRLGLMPGMLRVG